MKKQYLLFVFIFLSAFIVKAQGPVERVYVQTDRDYYVVGETIHFIGYVITDSDTMVSTDLFAEIWDNNFIKLGEICVPVIDGSASGSLNIPKDIKTTQVYLRAYTSFSAAQPEPFQFIKPLLHGTVTTKESTENFPSFYPEGGKLVYNAENVVAYKINPGSRATIRNSKNELIATLESYSNGLGSVSFRPVTGETYSVHWSQNGIEQVKALPVPVENGIAVHLRQSADTLYFDLDNGGNKNVNIRKPKIHLLINNEIAYLVELNMLAKDKFSYFIPLIEFQPGLAEFRILDSGDEILARRPFFIHRKSFAESPRLDFVKKDLTKRG